MRGAMYLRYEDLLWDRCWRMAEATGQDPEELMSVARLAFMRAAATWRAERAMFSTHLFHTVRGALSNYVRKTDLPPATDPAVALELRPAAGPGPDWPLRWAEWGEGLSEEAQEVVALLLASPAEALGVDSPPAPKMIRGRLRDYLHRERGWSLPQVWGVFREIESALVEL